MSNVTALPPPAALNPREAALQQARILALRIMGAAMLPADALAKEEPQVAVLAHRLGGYGPAPFTLTRHALGY